MTGPGAFVASWGLPTAHRPPTGPLDDDGFARLLAECEHERTLGLLGAATSAGALPASDGQRTALEDRWQAWCTHAVRAERLAARAIDALRGHEIPTLALKGVALAHTAYPDPAHRIFGDVDLLVDPARFSDAASTLVAQLGGRRAEPEVRPGFDDRFGREILVRVGSVEIDTHRMFVNGAFGHWARTAALFPATTDVTVGDHRIPVLPPPARVVHAAYTATLTDWPPRLIARRDLAQMALADDLDADEVIALARTWRAELVLAEAVEQSWRVLRITRGTPLLDWAQQLRPKRRDRALIAAYRGPARGYTGQLTALAAIPGLGARAAFLAAIACPAREYRDARNLGRWGLLGSGARRAKRSRSARPA